MADLVQVKGVAEIHIKPYGGTLEKLGYTRNGADMTLQSFQIPVPGDQRGGDAGVPIDIQLLGQIAHIRLEFTKYDETVMNKVKALAAAGTPGTFAPADVGLLYVQGLKYTRLLVKTANDPKNFPIVVWQEPQQWNAGSRFSMTVIAGTAYPDANGLLYDNVIV
jgi:hypothetical protein